MTKTALIFGSNGMDGSYMCELLLEKGYNVHGTIRRSSVITTERINHIFEKINLHYTDITDSMNVFNIISKIKPDEIYNFCAQSHVKISADLENYTFSVNTLGVLNILQSVKSLGIPCKIYQASTSEIMGNQTDGSFRMNEDTQQSPCSVYGISKHASQQLCNMYRDAYGIFVVNSILYNHESPRRGHNFVTQKISNYVANYFLKKTDKPLQLGNLNSKRDFGHAKDYVYAIYLMMQQDTPENFVIATGVSYSIRELCIKAFEKIGITVVFQGEGLEEIGLDSKTGKILIEVNSKYFRDIEIDVLLGDSSRAQEKLKWKPTISFDELVLEMVQESIKKFNK